MDPTSSKIAAVIGGQGPGSSYFKLTLPTDFNGTDSVQAIASDSAGNLYLTGGYTGVSNSVYVIKTKSDGTFVWGKRVTDTGTLEPQEIFVYGSNVIVLGIRKATTPWQSYWWKFDLAGNLQAQKSYGDGSNNYIGWNFAGINSSNGTVIGNSIYDSGYGYLQVAIDGSLDFAKTVTPASTYFAYYGGCCMDSNGNVYMAGRSQRDGSWPPYDMNGWVAKFNSSGTLQYQNWWGYTSTTYAGLASPSVDSNDDVYLIDNNAERPIQFLKMTAAGSITNAWTFPEAVPSRWFFDANDNMWAYSSGAWTVWDSSFTGEMRFSDADLSDKINIDNNKGVVQLSGQNGDMWSLPLDLSLQGSSGTGWTYTTTTPTSLSTATVGIPSISNPGSHSFGTRSTTTTTTTLTVASVTPTLAPDPI